MHTQSATQITVGSQRDILQAVSRFFLRPDEYSGLELRISTSINSTSNLDDSKQRQVRETLEHAFSVLIHYIYIKKKNLPGSTPETTVDTGCSGGHDY